MGFSSLEMRSVSRVKCPLSQMDGGFKLYICNKVVIVLKSERVRARERTKERKEKSKKRLEKIERK